MKFGGTDYRKHQTSTGHLLHIQNKSDHFLKVETTTKTNVSSGGSVISNASNTMDMNIPGTKGLFYRRKLPFQ